MFIEVNKIKIDRKKRQRKELQDIEELAASIEECGLINPIIIDEKNKLIAGERRLSAYKKLGYTTIEVRYFTDLQPSMRHLIELEENIRRKDITWQEKVAATEQYHKLKKKENPDWDQLDTALALNLSPSTVSTDLSLAKDLDDEDIASTDSYGKAVNKKKKKKERELHASLDDIDIGLFDEPKKPKVRNVSLLNRDFCKWAAHYKGPPFNFIHCDFPYGIEHGYGTGALANKDNKAYVDDTRAYDVLMEAIVEHHENFMSENCHIMFWCATKNMRRVWEDFYDLGFRCQYVPLIWYKQDSKGISPDPRYQPKHIYETAIIIHRGSRMLAKASVADVKPHRVVNQLHQSEKPVEMLEHFFQMFVDKYTTMLDPTCGCGNSVKVAEQMGAARAVGIEMDEDIYKVAKENLGI